MYVCQFVSWLTSLLKLYKYRDISSSERDIFLKFSGDIPRINLHYFQVLLNFMYVCQSVSWLTFLLKLDKYRDISSYVWDIFLNFLRHSWMFLHLYQIILKFLYVCLSVHWLTSLLKLGQYRDNSCSGWDIFRKFYGDIPWIYLHYFKIISIFCLSVSLLVAHFLTEIRPI